jgi:hypothetical protein
LQGSRQFALRSPDIPFGLTSRHTAGSVEGYLGNAGKSKPGFGVICIANGVFRRLITRFRQYTLKQNFKDKGSIPLILLNNPLADSGSSLWSKNDT